MKVPGHIYFAQSEHGGPVKIGFTTDLEQRLRNLQSASPYPLVLRATFPGTEADERKLHRRFAANRLHGEWFTPDASMENVVNGVGLPADHRPLKRMTSLLDRAIIELENGGV